MWSMILLMSRLPGGHSRSAGRRPEKLGYQQSEMRSDRRRSTAQPRSALTGRSRLSLLECTAFNSGSPSLVFHQFKDF